MDDIKNLEKQEIKPKTKMEKRALRDTFEGSKLLEEMVKRRNRFDYTLIHFSLIDNDMLQAILRRDVHKSTLYTHFAAGASQPRNTLDQPFAICSLEEQKQGYTSTFHRGLIWRKSHPVRLLEIA